MFTLAPVTDWQEAKTNYENGMTDDEIAFFHGVVVNTVKVYCNRHNWSRANFTHRRHMNTRFHRELFQVDHLPSQAVIASLFSQRKLEINAHKYRKAQWKGKHELEQSSI